MAQRSAPSDIIEKNLLGETIAAKSKSRKTNGGRAMRFTLKVVLKTIKNQLLSFLHSSSFGKQKNDFPGHLYLLCVQFIALHILPSPCNFLAVNSIACGDFHVRPKKKICWFRVTRPTLFFPADPKTFYSFLGKKKKKKKNWHKD